SMLPLLLLLLFSPFSSGQKTTSPIIRWFETCTVDLCLHYVAACNYGSGMWAARRHNELMDDKNCQLTVESVADLFLAIKTKTDHSWGVHVYSQSISSFSMESPRAMFKIDNNTAWRLEVNGTVKYIDPLHSIPPFTRPNLTRDGFKPYHIVELTVDTTGPSLFDLFHDASISFTLHSIVPGEGEKSEVLRYDGAEFWNILTDFEPLPCTPDIKPAFLIILIVYAIFATLAIVVLYFMIRSLNRNKNVNNFDSRKYDRVPTSDLLKTRPDVTWNWPEPTAADTTGPKQEIEPSQTDIDRLKTDVDSKTSNLN
ncbi:hypothetical protein PFISCL1PPCAC_7080, partial [Pristionchus fissidentatus]